MTAAYIRVSTNNQKTDSQKREIRRWAKAQGMNLKELTWYEDKASGRESKRPSLCELRKAVTDLLSTKKQVVKSIL
jgi:DNA invertase Pin-like site-specific DNA recombinase